MGMTNRHGGWIGALAGIILLGLGGCADESTNYSSEGTLEAPVDLGTAPVTVSGSVGGGGNSYYEIDVGNGNWLISVSQIDGDPDLRVYEDADYLSLKCTSANAGTTPDSCPVGCVGACTYYIRIYGYASNGASYALAVAPYVP